MHINPADNETLITLYASKGIAAAQRYLKNLEIDISDADLQAYLTDIKPAPTARQARLSDIKSSAEMLRGVIYAQAACCDRLADIAIETGSYRVNAVLSESLTRLHSQLSTIDF